MVICPLSLSCLMVSSLPEAGKAGASGHATTKHLPSSPLRFGPLDLLSCTLGITVENRHRKWTG